MNGLHIISFAVVATGLYGICRTFDVVFNNRSYDDDAVVAATGVSILMVFMGSIPFWS